MRCSCGALARYRCDCGQWLCGEDQCPNNCGGAVRRLEDIKSFEISTDKLFKLIKDIREFRKTMIANNKQDIIVKYKLRIVHDTLNSILHNHGLDGLFNTLHQMQNNSNKTFELFDAIQGENNGNEI